MWDGIHIDTIPDFVQSNDILEFRQGRNEAMIAKHKGFIVSLFPHYCNIRGSIHRYKNNGEHNADDFKLSDFRHALKDFAVTLNIHPAVTTLRGLEFGVNFSPPQPYSAEMILRTIKHYKKAKIQAKTNEVRFVFKQYEIKIYIKKHKSCPVPLLRFEVKVKKSVKLKQLLGINRDCRISYRRLIDLSNPVIMRLAGNALLKIFDNILIVDCNSIDKLQLNKKDLDLFLKGCDPFYWSDSENANTSTRHNRLKRFREIVKKYSTSTLKEDIRQIIADKIDCLIDVLDERKDTFLSEFGTFLPKVESDFKENLPSERSSKMGRFYRLDNRLIRPMRRITAISKFVFSKHIIYPRLKLKNKKTKKQKEVHPF